MYPYIILPDPSRGENKTHVYLQLCRPSNEVPTVDQAMDYLRGLPRPIKFRLLTPKDSDLTVRIELCARLRIIAGYTAHQLQRGEPELSEILDVLKANGLEVSS